MTKRELIAAASLRYEEDQVLELEHAINFATEKHRGQKRKSGEPYIIHPLAVAEILVDWDMDIDTVIAGVLHDTVEDTDTSLEQIETMFGHDVAFLVDGVTKVSQARAGMKNLDHYPHRQPTICQSFLLRLDKTCASLLSSLPIDSTTSQPFST
jgi:GTP pyrophosphokinase